MQHQIVFLDRESVGANVRKPEFPHSYKEYEATWTPEEILERLKDATIAIINKVPMRGDTLKQLPKLKLIAVAATGTDCVDKAACAARGVVVSNIRGYAINTVPEHTFALILALRRNLLAVQAGLVEQSGFVGARGPLDGTTLEDAHPQIETASITAARRRRAVPIDLSLSEPPSRCHAEPHG